MKEKFIKYWKVVAALMVAIVSTLIFRKQGTTKSDSKPNIDIVVKDLGPKTEKAESTISDIQKSVDTESPKYDGADIDIKKIVEDYDKL